MSIAANIALVFPKSSQNEFHSCDRAKREQSNNNNS